MEYHRKALKLSVTQEYAGLRLDNYVFRVVDCSRSYAAQLIRKGHILVDELHSKPSHKIKIHEQISIRIPPPDPVALTPEPLHLDILFEDQHLIVINKPAGLVVHPAAGHASGTLVNGILHHCPELSGIGGEIRPGIVHRLDKDTSGIIVVAKTAGAMTGLSQQFKLRKVCKQYLALIHGHPIRQSGRIDLPIGRHPTDRKKMSTTSPRGREAITMWQIKEKFKYATLLDINLKTGRTHQIRVHCKSMGHPIIGDPVYGLGKELSHLNKQDACVYKAVQKAARQMLHAHRIGFSHPVTAENHQLEAPLPEDMMCVMKVLKKN